MTKVKPKPKARRTAKAKAKRPAPARRPKPSKQAAGAARSVEQALREIALAYPETHEDFPWGERVIKVRKKVFLFMGSDGEGFGISVKLPETASMALLLPFVEPTGYGLGKSGWVSARFPPKASPPIDLVRAWIDESYRAIAPATLVKKLPAK